MTFDFDLLLGNFLTFGALLGFFGGRNTLQNGFGCTNVVEQLLFSMFSSIITFIFYLILRLILTCWCPHGLILWPDKGPKTVLDSTTVVEQH